MVRGVHQMLPDPRLQPFLQELDAEEVLVKPR
jgi:hypothetical protein